MQWIYAHQSLDHRLIRNLNEDVAVLDLAADVEEIDCPSLDSKPVAVLLAPMDEDDLDRLMLARSPKFQALLGKSRRSIAAGKRLARDEFWKAVGRQRGKK